MKNIFVFIAVLLVLGCASKPASVTVADSAKESISALEKSLPSECKTESIKNQITVISKLVEAQLQVCASEKETLKAENKLSTMISMVLFLVIFGLLVFKFF